ncbi:UNVERIFIED_CONTAM: Alpha-1,3-arabinosyltransferase XAT2 [Sesamum angustifolium]|uniref:Alpha-1,3-arabinosyltransferase XAT2 n=1 Tax=Sesamum angustifolium TaxID=2727405 RepID=A0AAW2RIX7_9LAMI
MLMSTEEISKPRQSYIDADEISPNPILGNFSNSRSQVYEMSGDIRIHGNSSTIFIASTQAQDRTTSWTVKPYARKGDKVVMGKVRTFKIIPQASLATPHCTQNFSVPAIVFSGGGYAGNHFHDFTDVLIPLYLTSREFNRTVLFLVANKRSWWTTKYKVLLQKLSKFDVIDIDNENQVLCFPRMIVGLKAHKELSIDPLKSPHNYSVTDFTRFLRSTYSLKRQFANDCDRNHKYCSTRRRPRLLIISRKKTRHLVNEGEVTNLGRSLGFDVVVREMGGQVSLVARFVNSFDVMVGVHGAGLTNMVFLPKNAVVIQIVPLGLDFLAKHYFQLPAKDMKLKYLEYKVRLNESSLLARYPGRPTVKSIETLLLVMGKDGMIFVLFIWTIKM